MMYTQHGHFIEGSEGVGHNKKPTTVARCGGPGLCRVCTLEASVRMKHHLEIPYLVERKEPHFKVMQFGPSYILAGNCLKWLKDEGYPAHAEGQLEVLVIGDYIESQVRAALGWWIVIEDGKPESYTDEMFRTKYRFP